ncbi:MAG: hypothetical protein JWQ02_1389 [Capsulimonas sp.]|nr:hypothetical protein [Capsulimonas sp.]
MAASGKSPGNCLKASRFAHRSMITTGLARVFILFRARELAKQQYGAEWSVLRANIVLGDCLNLLDTEYFLDLQLVCNAVFEAFRSQGKELPSNRRGANRLDRMVIDGFVGKYALQNGFFDTVRGCFPEGSVLFEGSQLLSHTHVQIAVRNQACISGVELVNFN